MTQAHKQIFQKMNLDADSAFSKPNEYSYLKNGVPLQQQSGHDGGVSNVWGNTLITNSSMPSGTNVLIGQLNDNVGNRIFYFVYNSSNNHSIFMIDSTLTTTLVFQWSGLNFTSSMKITAIAIIGDILVWSDEGNEIRKINITKAIASVYTPTDIEISLIKRPPQLPLMIYDVVYDFATTNNFVSGHYFQFYHRFIYEDGDVSVFSASSLIVDSWKLPPTSVLLASGTNQLVLGLYDIDGFTFGAGARVLLYGQTLPSFNGIWITSSGAWTRATDADTSAELLALNIYVQTGIVNGDTTFKISNTSAITVGVTPINFESTKGPNSIYLRLPGGSSFPGIPDADVPNTVREIEVAVRVDDTTEVFVFLKSKYPFNEFPYIFYNDTFLYTVPDSEVLKFNDSVPLRCKGLSIFKNRIFTLNNTEGYDHSPTSIITLSLTSVGLGSTRSVQHHKEGATYNVGIMFFDEFGRHSGIQCANNINIPFVDTSGAYIITYDLSSISTVDIPLWARYYEIMVTNVTNKSFFTQQQTTDVFYYKKDADGVITYTKTLSGDFTGTALLIVGLGYTLQNGDRIRLYKSSSDPIVDTEILSQNGNFIYTRLLQEFDPLDITDQDILAFEIYTPKKATIEPFFEVGAKHIIDNAGGVSRAFSVMTENLGGDVVSVLKKIYLTTGAYSPTDPYSNEYIVSNTRGFFESMSAYDNSLWIHGLGKSSIVTGDDSKEYTKTNYVRFSQPIVFGSTVFGGNTFSAFDEYALPIENGVGIRLCAVSNILVALHERESEAIYVNEAYLNMSEGSQFLSKTDGVIGDTRRYFGGHGTYNPESVFVYGDLVYFFDIFKGCIVRRSNDGLTVISDYGVKNFIKKFSIDYFADRDDLRFLGGYDSRLNLFLLTVKLANGDHLWTIAFHEPSNAWIGFFDYDVEGYANINSLMVTFQDQMAWIHDDQVNHNTFFGDYFSRLLEFNMSPLYPKVKILKNIELDADFISS